jgi:hypothetical protein
MDGGVRAPIGRLVSRAARYDRTPLAACDCAKVGNRNARHQYADGVAETSYASCGDLSLAYQVFGDGPVELVFVGSFVSHVELTWAQPEFKAFFEQLATFCHVVLFDNAGVGLASIESRSVMFPKGRTPLHRRIAASAHPHSIASDHSIWPSTPNALAMSR